MLRTGWPRFEPATLVDPPTSRILFADTRLAWFWLAVRLFVGSQWLQSGWGKFGQPAWMETGEALRGFWERAVALPEPPARPPITYEWYRSFLTWLLEGGHHTWFAPVVVWGELLIGIALILGAFTGIAAFFGAFMNMNFMLAGTTSTNPVLFFLQIGIILAWKIAGYIGLDYFLLQLLGTPWRPGAILRRDQGTGPQAPERAEAVEREEERRRAA